MIALLPYLRGLPVTQGRLAGQTFSVLPWQRRFVCGAFAPGVPSAALSIFEQSKRCYGAPRFYTLREAQVLIESWRRHYNAFRPHGSLGYRPPAPETIVMPSCPPGSATLRRPPSVAEKPSMH